jgi:hypothetical protein
MQGSHPEGTDARRSTISSAASRQYTDQGLFLDRPGGCTGYLLVHI